jgi:hypothetical protein
VHALSQFPGDFPFSFRYLQSMKKIKACCRLGGRLAVKRARLQNDSFAGAPFGKTVFRAKIMP